VEIKVELPQSSSSEHKCFVWTRKHGLFPGPPPLQISTVQSQEHRVIGRYVLSLNNLRNQASTKIKFSVALTQHEHCESTKRKTRQLNAQAGVELPWVPVKAKATAETATIETLCAEIDRSVRSVLDIDVEVGPDQCIEKYFELRQYYRLSFANSNGRAWPIQGEIECGALVQVEPPGHRTWWQKIGSPVRRLLRVMGERSMNDCPAGMHSTAVRKLDNHPSATNNASSRHCCSTPAQVVRVRARVSGELHSCGHAYSGCVQAQSSCVHNLL
jgi:hypothetical protein